MGKSLKFKGKFKELKTLGYEFMKLYARNYKVYRKKLDSGLKIWVWVGNGGYIEIDDLYCSTKNYIKAIKSINWDDIKPTPNGYRYVYFRYEHGKPKKGFEIKPRSFDFETMVLSYDDNVTFDDAYEQVREKFNSEKSISYDSAMELLNELKQINS